jgi:hypothetical protein
MLNVKGKIFLLLMDRCTHVWRGILRDATVNLRVAQFNHISASNEL